MDLQPPQAPPAAIHDSTETREVIVARLEATRAWLDTALAREPMLPDEVQATGRDAFLAAYDAHWSEAEKSALAAQFIAAMRDDALLRQRDGTLNSADQQRIAAFTATQGLISPAGFEPRDLLFSGEAYAGAIVLAGRVAGTPSLLFMPDRGWEAFTSLDTLHEAVESRIRHELLTRDTLPGIRVGVVDRMVREQAFITSRPSPADAMGGTAATVIATRRAQVGDAWQALTMGDAAAGAADAVRSALDLHRTLDIDAMAIDRLQRKVAAHHAARLAAVPRDAREEWQNAVSALRHEYDQAADALQVSGTPPVAAPAGDITHPDTVRAYRDALLAAFDPRAGGRIRQHIAARIARARLAAAAADARLGYYLPGDPPAYLPDRGERGHAWLRAVVDGPVAATRRPVDGHDIVVRQFTYRGAVVGDLLIIGARRPESVPRVVLYTPDAPDGRSVREFEDAEQAARAVLYNPLFESWLLDRLPASHAAVDGNGNRHFAIPEDVRRSRWVLAQQNDGAHTLTAEVFREREVPGHVFEALHAASVSRMVLDMSELEATLRDMSPATPLDLASALGDLGSGAWMARQVFAGLAGGMRAWWRAGDALRVGDYRQAFLDATEAYVGLLGVIPAVHVAARPAAYLRPALNRAPGTAFMGAVRFDPRYAAKSISLAHARPDSQGIYTIGGRRYIASAGAVHEIRFDDVHATWRLARPGSADTHYTGPAIAWSNGTWHVRTDLGLRGGRRAPEVLAPEHPIRTISEADYEALSAHQRGEFLRVLRQRLGGSVADDLHADVLFAAGAPVSVGPRVSHAWHQALEAARRAPAVPPAPPAPPPLVPRPPWRELPPEAWPESVWHHPPDYALPLDHPSLYLPALRVPGSGLSGLVALPRQPSFPAGGAARPWVRIDLHRLRADGAAPGRIAMRVFVDETGPEAQYLVRGNSDVHDMFLVLRPGQFQSGP